MDRSAFPSLRVLTAAMAAIAMVLGTVAHAPVADAAVVSVDQDRFSDDDTSVHEGSINALHEAGLVNGCDPPANERFCPDRTVSRGEMASVLARMQNLADTGGDLTFVDTATSVHRHAIEAIAAEEITLGCNPPTNNRFCPAGKVTRGQAAAFLVRALGYESPGQVFDDAAGHVFEFELGALEAAGVLRGCNPPANTKICPDRSLTRGEMATMVGRAMGLEPIEIDRPQPDPPPGEEPDPGDGPGDGPPTGGSSYPGQPPVGTVLWGAHIQGNGDPYPRHEAPANAVMTLNRTFYQWNQRTAPGFRSNVEEDIDRGRVPWVSFKPPGAWPQVASGAHDGEIDVLLEYLDGVGGPVWLTIHHEPEDDVGQMGTPAQHLAMNRRVRQRMEALGIDNVALSVVLMGWTWDSRSGRNPSDYWDSKVYDFVGVDPYVCQDNAPDCQHHSILEHLGGGNGWSTIRHWAGDRGVDVAVAEWGMRGTNADAGSRVREWYESVTRSHKDNGGARVVGLAAFDSGANSPGGAWTLEGEQLTTFRALMQDDRTAQP